jgi:hypothetical protein
MDCVRSTGALVEVVYYFNTETDEVRWTKPSHDKEVDDFLRRHGVVTSSIDAQSESDRHHVSSLKVNVKEALEKLRRQPKYYAGRRSFMVFALYLISLFMFWGVLADVSSSQGFEMGLRERIDNIQFEVTPGPYSSQLIRTTNWEGIRTLGDLQDWTLAAVEELYADDDQTYFTPSDRVQMKQNSLNTVWRNHEFAPLWSDMGIDTDPAGVRQNCTNWIVNQPDIAAWVPPCEFFSSACGAARMLDGTKRIVALAGPTASTNFTAREQQCLALSCSDGFDLLSGAGCITNTGQLLKCSDQGCKLRHRLADLSGRCALWLQAQPAATAATGLDACLRAGGPTDAQCKEATAAQPSRSGAELRLACQNVSGCMYWKVRARPLSL